MACVAKKCFKHPSTKGAEILACVEKKCFKHPSTKGAAILACVENNCFKHPSTKGAGRVRGPCCGTCAGVAPRKSDGCFKSASCRTRSYSRRPCPSGEGRNHHERIIQQTVQEVVEVPVPMAQEEIMHVPMVVSHHRHHHVEQANLFRVRVCPA